MRESFSGLSGLVRQRFEVNFALGPRASARKVLEKQAKNFSKAC